MKLFTLSGLFQGFESMIFLMTFSSNVDFILCLLIFMDYVNTSIFSKLLPNGFLDLLQALFIICVCF